MGGARSPERAVGVRRRESQDVGNKEWKLAFGDKRDGPLAPPGNPCPFFFFLLGYSMGEEKSSCQAPAFPDEGAERRRVPPRAGELGLLSPREEAGQ